MRRCRAWVFVAALGVVGVGGSLALPGAPEPLPVLANGPSWAPAPVSRQSSGADDRTWLAAGTVPGHGLRRDIVARALLDLRELTRSNGAVLAGPSGAWRYAWPRDSSFVAAAFAVTGHRDDAWRVLHFLSSVQLRDGGFEARYTIDGAGPPDDRQRQVDSAGWVLWALDRVRLAGVGSGDSLVAPGLRPMRDRAVAFIWRETAGATRLPDPSPDYWEVPERLTTLGAVAPLAAGLEAAARSIAAEGDPGRAADLRSGARRLRALIAHYFAPGYGRHGDGTPRDAAVAMLLPPFAERADTAVVAAWQRYAVEALRPGGGLAPGVGWKHDGVSWTPETALVAYTAAAAGRADVAEHWLDWLDRHRTTWGSFPEKVCPNGSPAGPAPLAWTAALVVLAEDALAEQAPAPEIGAQES